MAPVRADDEIGQEGLFAIGRLDTYTGDALLLEDQIDHLMLHAQSEGRKPFGFGVAKGFSCRPSMRVRLEIGQDFRGLVRFAPPQ
jgi:hypothetical protein